MDSLINNATCTYSSNHSLHCLKHVSESPKAVNKVVYPQPMSVVGQVGSFSPWESLILLAFSSVSSALLKLRLWTSTCFVHKSELPSPDKSFRCSRHNKKPRMYTSRWMPRDWMGPTILQPTSAPYRATWAASGKGFWCGCLSPYLLYIFSLLQCKCSPNLI